MFLFVLNFPTQTTYVHQYQFPLATTYSFTMVPILSWHCDILSHVVTCDVIYLSLKSPKQTPLLLHVFHETCVLSRQTATQSAHFQHPTPQVWSLFVELKSMEACSKIVCNFPPDIHTSGATGVNIKSEVARGDIRSPSLSKLVPLHLCDVTRNDPSSIIPTMNENCIYYQIPNYSMAGMLVGLKQCSYRVDHGTRTIFCTNG